MSRRLITVAIVFILARNNQCVLENYFKEQTQKVNTFFQDQFNRVENAVHHNYDEVVKVKTRVDNYIEKQKKVISEDVNNYVENVKANGRNLADTYSFMPTENPASLIDQPQLVLSVPAIIISNGYDCETHSVKSPDGFILTLHRIPRPKSGGDVSKNTVILQHGILASSADWILNGPEKALAYVLADAGYDVWMTNIRGNKYSKEHTRFRIKTKEYWNFSWHDAAVYDMPATIDYIQKIKGKDAKIAYIGYSMGTTILFGMLSVRPEYNDKLSVAIALAPEVFIGNMQSPMKSLANIASNLAYTDLMYGYYQFVPKNSLVNQMCKAQHSNSNVCNNIIFYICGDDPVQLNKTLMPIFLQNLGSGSSWKTVLHMGQMALSGRFQQFDYGLEERNLRMYGTPTPPDYDLSKVTLNITMFWSRNDLMSNEKDVRKLHEMLPSNTEMYEVPFEKFNHIDYLWAVDAPRLINKKVLQILKDSFRPYGKDIFFDFNFG